MENMNNINEGRLCDLIALLREHCRKHYGFKDNDDIEIDHDSVQFHLYHNAKRCFSIGVEKVICKEFGFIERLVKENKIDIERLHKIVDYRLEIKENYLNAHDYNSDCLLMLLAISQNPISDLISYLK